jgi:hypothetical protein
VHHAIEIEATMGNDGGSSGESEVEVEEVAAPSKSFRPFKGLPARVAAPASRSGKKVEEVVGLRAEVARLKRCEEEASRLRAELARVRGGEGELARLREENARLRERNEVLVASQERHRDFLLNTRHHARTWNVELLAHSNKFYQWAMDWHNAEKDISEFAEAEERKLE